MTQRELRELRGLDQLVAEKVFGWRFEDYHNGGGYWHRWAECKRKAGSSFCECGGTHYCPEFSTNPVWSKVLRDQLAERWDVLELRRTRTGWHFNLMVRRGNEDTGINLIKHRMTAETEELAIVLCALKSVGAYDEFRLPESSR